MPLPLTVSCFSKIQIGFTFLVPAHPGSPGQRAVKRVCVYALLVFQLSQGSVATFTGLGGQNSHLYVSFIPKSDRKSSIKIH